MALHYTMKELLDLRSNYVDRTNGNVVDRLLATLDERDARIRELEGIAAKLAAQIAWNEPSEQR